MELFIVRHAIAVPRRADLADQARPLTAKGRRRFERVVRGLKKMKVDFDRLYHSPWLRAVETAEILAPLVTGETVVELGLTRPPERDFIDGMEGSRVAVVGHEPWLSELLSVLLCGGKSYASRFDLKKGGVAWLVGDPRPRRMQMLAFLPPHLLRRL